jgi:hypothetical protein
MMSEKFHIPYDDIYDLWILNYRKSKNEIWNLWKTWRWV